MPILTSSPGVVTGIVAAAPGLAVQVSAPSGTAGVPPGGPVVGWVLIVDAGAVGGTRVDPVFLADGRAWTPDQFRAAYGQQLAVQIGATR